MIVVSCCVTVCVTQKYLISMCLVRSDVDRPLAMSAMHDLLSWYSIAGGTRCPCALKNHTAAIATLVESDSATNSASVLDLVIILCFVDLKYDAPLSPMVSVHPV